MKRLFLFLVALVSAVTMMGQEPTFLKTLVPDNKIHDFGTIQENGGKVSHTFVLKNTGSKPVSITEVNAWCGCTTTDYTKAAILPGKTAKVTVTYNPYGRPGKFSKEVVALLNDGKQYIRLWIKGDVKGFLHPVTEDHPYAFGEGLYMSYKKLPFPNMKKGEKYTFKLRVANDTKEIMNVDFVRRPNNKTLQMPNHLTLQPNERRVVEVSYTQPREYDYARYIMVDVYVNGKKVEPLKVLWVKNTRFQMNPDSK